MQIEVEELRNKIERSRTIITELGKTNASLETKLSTSMSNEERESLTRQNRELRTVETFKERFDAFVHGTQEHLAQLAGTVASKAVENEELNEKVKNLAEELELTKFQVSDRHLNDQDIKILTRALKYKPYLVSLYSLESEPRVHLGQRAIVSFDF